MSAALQLPFLWAAQSSSARQFGPLQSAVNHIHKKLPPDTASKPQTPEPLVSYAFYRKHTESLIRRYLHASMTIGRSPTLLGESVGRGWVSSRKIRTFEDALIFVIDVESCLKKLSKLDLQMISRVVVQENSYQEAAALLGMSIRNFSSKLPEAIDRLTECLIKHELLTIPD